VVLIENVEGRILIDAGFRWSARTLNAFLNFNWLWTGWS